MKFESENQDLFDPAFETLLSEALGGPQTPDLSDQILAALNRPPVEPLAGAPPVVSVPASVTTPGQTIGKNIGKSIGKSIGRAELLSTTLQPEPLKTLAGTRWRTLIGILTIAAIALVAVFLNRDPKTDDAGIAEQAQSATGADALAANNPAADQEPGNGEATQFPKRKPVTPIELPGPNFDDARIAESDTSSGGDRGLAKLVASYPPPPAALDDRTIIERIDRQLAAAWKTNAVEPTGEINLPLLRNRLATLFGKDVIPLDTDPRSLAGIVRATLADSTLADSDARRHLAGLFAVALLGKEGAARVRGDQLAGFVLFLESAFSGRRGFDQLSQEMLVSRGSVEPTVDGFQPSAVLMGSLAGPRSVALAEQVAHSFLDINLACGRCHDHPLDGRVSQEQYWQFAAAFETGLKWSVDEQGAMRIDTVEKPAATDPGIVFYESIDGRQRVASAGIPVDWLTSDAEAGKDWGTDKPGHGQSELDRLAEVLRGNPQLALATVNRAWETVYGRPLVGWAANPSAAPEMLELIELQDFLGEQLRAHQFDLGSLYAWVIAARPFRLAAPDVWQSPRFETASENDLKLAEDRVRSFAGFVEAKRPPHELKQLLAMVEVSDGGLVDSLDDTFSNRRRLLLGQFEPAKPIAPPSQPSGPPGEQDTSVNRLRASLEAMPSGLPVAWLEQLDGVDAFDRRVEHLYYLAGYNEPSKLQREIAAALKASAGDETQALQRLWWVLSNE